MPSDPATQTPGPNQNAAPGPIQLAEIRQPARGSPPESRIPLSLSHSVLRAISPWRSPPLAAVALGFHHTTTNRQVRNTGGTWTRYVATRT